MTSNSDDMSAMIAELQAQETRLVFTRFTNSDAWALGSLLVRLGTERGLPIAIDIRRSGQQLFHAALDGTAPDNDGWIERKVNTVTRYGNSSFLIGRQLAVKGDTLDQHKGVDPIDFASHGGAFPIRIKDVGVVGTVTVSGLPQSADHALVVEAIEMFLAE